MAIVTLPESLAPDVVSDGPLREFVDGQMVEMPPMGIYPVEVAMKIGASLDVFGRSNDVGRAINEALIRIDSTNSYRPDVAFVSFEKWPKRLRTPNKEPWQVVPDIVVEVISENDKAWAVQEKTHRYLEIGTKQVWLVYPNLEVIHIYEAITAIRVLTRSNDLDGGLLIPGFRLSLESLFEGEEPDEAPTA